MMNFVYFFLAIFSCSLLAMNSLYEAPKKTVKFRHNKELFNTLLLCIHNYDLINVRNILKYYQQTNRLGELNRYGKRGLPPLHEALTCRPVYAEIVEYLLCYGADPNLKVKRKEIIVRKRGKKGKQAFCGWTAAHIATRFVDQEQIFYLLKKYFTDFKECDADGWSPLRVAQYDGNEWAEAIITTFYPPPRGPLEQCLQEPLRDSWLWSPPEGRWPFNDETFLVGARPEPKEKTESREITVSCPLREEVQQELAAEEQVLAVAIKNKGTEGIEKERPLIIQIFVVSALGIGIFCCIGF